MTILEIIDGMITIDSEVGKQLGFTSDRFLPDSYLWKKGDTVFVSFIASQEPGRGDLTRLFAAIETAGFKVAVPTPLGRMTEILQRKGFVMHVEPDDVMGDVEVWRKS